jgi:DNA-binding transcriptional MocR family regulator
MATSTTTKQSSLVTVKRQVLRDEVREAIISAILTGEFQPGDRIVESRVARELGVSQATIREALREPKPLPTGRHTRLHADWASRRLIGPARVRLPNVAG